MICKDILDNDKDGLEELYKGLEIHKDGEVLRVKELEEQKDEVRNKVDSYLHVCL